jgi:hypothetical protein
LQQLLVSQQAGLSQQVKTVAAWAARERNRTARTANTLNFMAIISVFEQAVEGYRMPESSGMLLMEEEDHL